MTYEEIMRVERMRSYNSFVDEYLAKSRGEQEYLSWLSEHDRLLIVDPGELEYRSWQKSSF